MPTTELLELLHNSKLAAGVENGLTGTVIAVVAFIDVVAALILNTRGILLTRCFPVAWDIDVCAILLLLHLLPPSAQGRKRPGSQAVDHLIGFIKLCWTVFYKLYFPSSNSSTVWDDLSCCCLLLNTAVKCVVGWTFWWPPKATSTTFLLRDAQETVFIVPSLWLRSMDFYVSQQGSLGWGVGALDELFRPIMSLLRHTVLPWPVFFSLFCKHPFTSLVLEKQRKLSFRVASRNGALDHTVKCFLCKTDDGQLKSPIKPLRVIHGF